jgi:mutator protein MutT
VSKNPIAKLWHAVPSSVRLWALRLTNARFTVTAGAVIFNKRNQVLLLKHPFRAGSGWGLPGGFLTHGEQPIEALRRELEEEVKLKVDHVELFWVRSFKRPKQIEILFTAETCALPQPQSMEVECAVWFDSNELPEGLPKDQKALVERAVEKRRV